MMTLRSHTKTTKPDSVDCRICDETNAGGRRHYTVAPGSPQVWKKMMQLHFALVPWKAKAYQEKHGGPDPAAECITCSVKWPCETIKSLAEHFNEIETETSVRLDDSEFRYAKGLI